MKLPFNIRETADFDAVGFGSNAVDHLIVVEDFPAFNSKVEFLDHLRAAGGEVATTLAGLQRLGLLTAYAGRFGDDDEGYFGVESLVRDGVDTTYCERIADAATQTAFIIVERATGERTILWNRDEKLAYEAGAAPVEAAERCKVLHMTAHDAGACLRMAAAAKRNAALVSVDIDRVLNGLDELLPIVDILISSSDFLHRVTGSADRRAALRMLHQRYGCPITGATLGQDGSLIYCEGSFIDTPAFEVPGGCIDTTGAGDAFRTGFLYGLLTGEDIDTCARLANATAALKCRRLGARTGLPTSQELASFMS